MRLIDGDAVKERLKNDIKGMEERKEKEKGMFERMEIMSQLSFARYAYAVSIKEPTVPAITLDRIKEAREELAKKVEDYSHTGEREIEAYKTGLEDALEFYDNLIAESEGKE